jgi:folate-dependent phosphoribosylglycinamide formyltransferase PurN
MGSKIPRLVIITSGDGGTTAEAFIHAAQAGFVNAVVTDVIYNNPPASDDITNHIMARVKRLNKQYAAYGAHPGVNIVLHQINNTTHPRGLTDKTAITDEASEAMCKVLEEADATLGMLLGFRKKVRGALQTRYADRGLLTNNHPGRVDIPELRGVWGDGVHQKAYDLAKIGKIDHTGLTVQLVDPEYDMGTILETVAVPIGPTDSVEDIRNNVQMVEKVYTPKIIGDYLAQLQKNSRAS